MKKIILTLDYELYGNGSGNVFKHIIEPTKRILDIAKRYNVKLTIFFEVIEYWKLKEEWEKGNRMGYNKNPIVAIEEQLQFAYYAGHDIQLHLHPQWIDAYYQNDEWHVNLKEWRLGGYNRIGEYSLFNLFKKGKETIEKIIHPIDPNYTCIALRAGGYNIQPSFEIVKAMQKTNLFIDSSIYPGGKETGALSHYDYSNIPHDMSYWHVDKELETIGNSAIIELPIVAFPITRWTKYCSLVRIKSLLQNRKSAKESFIAKSSGQDKNILDRIRYFFSKEWQTWDYCLFSPQMHKRFLKRIEQQYHKELFVLVGHPKSFVSEKGFKYLLNKINKHFQCKTITDINKDFYD